MLLGVVIYLSLMPAAIAAQSATTHAEIAHLIDAVERSNCEFLRNGSWYDARQAASHLRNKYQLLSATDQIASAEDFISKAASQSSFSGQAYGLRCTGGALVSSAQWLNAALAKYRGALVPGGATQPTANAVDHAVSCLHGKISRRPGCEYRFVQPAHSQWRAPSPLHYLCLPECARYHLTTPRRPCRCRHECARDW